jgi:CubicO group peptidase (beta-lactamase class C family)
MMRLAILLVVTLVYAPGSVAHALILTAQETGTSRVSVSAQRLARIDNVVEEAIAQHELPGAVVLIGRKEAVVWRKAYGASALLPAREPMTPKTIFDLASLTKIVATATSIMLLVERGRVRLRDPLSRYIPEIDGAG